MESTLPGARVTVGGGLSIDLQRVIADRVLRSSRESRNVDPTRNDKALIKTYGMTHDELAMSSHGKYIEKEHVRKQSSLDKHLSRPNSPYLTQYRTLLRSRGASGIFPTTREEDGFWRMMQEQSGAEATARPHHDEQYEKLCALRRLALESRQRKTAAVSTGPVAVKMIVREQEKNRRRGEEILEHDGVLGNLTSRETKARTDMSASASSSSHSRLDLKDFVYVVSADEVDGGKLIVSTSTTNASSASRQTSSRGGTGDVSSSTVYQESINGGGVEDRFTSDSPPGTPLSGARVRPRTPSTSAGAAGVSSSSFPASSLSPLTALKEQSQGKPTHPMQHQIYPGRVYPGAGDFGPHSHSFRDRIAEKEVGPSSRISVSLKADPKRAFGRPGELDVEATALIQAENASFRRDEHPFLTSTSRVIRPLDEYSDPVNMTMPDVRPVPGEKERRETAISRGFIVLPNKVDALRTDTPWSAWKLPVVPVSPGHHVGGGTDLGSSSFWREPITSESSRRHDTINAQRFFPEGKKSLREKNKAAAALIDPSIKPDHTLESLGLLSPMRTGAKLPTSYDVNERHISGGPSRSPTTMRTQEVHIARVREARGPDPAQLLKFSKDELRGESSSFDINIRSFAKSGQDPIGLVSRSRDQGLVEAVRLSEKALQKVTNFYSDPVRDSELSSSVYRDATLYKRAVLTSAGLDGKRLAPIALQTTLGGGSVAALPPTGSFQDSLFKDDTNKTLAKSLHGEAIFQSMIPRRK